MSSSFDWGHQCIRLLSEFSFSQNSAFRKCHRGSIKNINALDLSQNSQWLYWKIDFEKAHRQRVVSSKMKLRRSNIRNDTETWKFNITRVILIELISTKSYAIHVHSFCQVQSISSRAAVFSQDKCSALFAISSRSHRRLVIFLKLLFADDFYLQLRCILYSTCFCIGVNCERIQ